MRSFVGLRGEEVRRILAGVASLNTAARELVLKIVYYGPGLGGKTTSLQALHQSAPPERRGKLVSLATPVDRTLYFDFLPLRLPPLRGLSVRLQLFTVPGQVYFNATRRLVLSGCDGVVFVADSQVDRMDANLESLENLCDNLAEHGRELATLPHVFSWNKRDLDELVPLDELEGALNRYGAPGFGTVATRGVGVDDTLEKITALVLAAYEAQIPAAPASIVHGGATFQLSPPTVSISGGELAEPEIEIQTSAASVASDPASPPSLEVITSATLKQPSEGTFLADLERIEASAKRPEPYDGLDDDERLVDRWETPSDAPPATRQFDAHADAAVIVERAIASSSTSRPVSPLPAHDQPTSVGEPGSPRVSHAAHPPAMGTADTAPPLASAPRVERARAIEGGAGASLSFAPLFAPTERALVEQIEASIAHGAYADALGMCEAALRRLLASVASLIAGDEHAALQDPSVALLVGLDGRRYLAFRALARRARLVGDVGIVDALESYAFLLEAKVAASQWDALRAALGANSAAPPARASAPPASAGIPPLPPSSISPPPPTRLAARDELAAALRADPRREPDDEPTHEPHASNGGAAVEGDDGARRVSAPGIPASHDG